MKYSIQFHDYWCTASGLSGGAKADILTLKDTDGLPYVPGRTIKGLLREAAETICAFDDSMISAEQITAIFGSNDDKDENRTHGQA